MVGHDSQPLPPWDESADVHSSLLRSLSAGPGRFVRWCPGSCTVRLQRLQDHPAECGPLARGAEPRSTMQITGDTSYAVSSRARFAMKLLIHDVFLPRSLRRAPDPPSPELRPVHRWAPTCGTFHRLRRYEVARRQFTGCDSSTMFIAVSF